MSTVQWRSLHAYGFKFLRIQWEELCFSWIFMVFGLCITPRTFIFILKKGERKMSRWNPPLCKFQLPFVHKIMGEPGTLCLHCIVFCCTVPIQSTRLWSHWGRYLLNVSYLFNYCTAPCTWQQCINNKMFGIYFKSSLLFYIDYSNQEFNFST